MNKLLFLFNNICLTNVTLNNNKDNINEEYKYYIKTQLKLLPYNYFEFCEYITIKLNSVLIQKCNININERVIIDFNILNKLHKFKVKTSFIISIKYDYNINCKRLRIKHINNHTTISHSDGKIDLHFIKYDINDIFINDSLLNINVLERLFDIYINYLPPLL